MFGFLKTFWTATEGNIGDPKGAQNATVKEGKASAFPPKNIFLEQNNANPCFAAPCRVFHTHEAAKREKNLSEALLLCRKTAAERGRSPFPSEPAF